MVAVSEGRLKVLYGSKVKTVHDTSVEIEHEGKVIDLPNQAIICCAGGILPTALLKQIGIEIETKHGAK